LRSQIVPCYAYEMPMNNALVTFVCTSITNAIVDETEMMKSRFQEENAKKTLLYWSSKEIALKSLEKNIRKQTGRPA